jgi:hypothetical protein
MFVTLIRGVVNTLLGDLQRAEATATADLGPPRRGKGEEGGRAAT